ncbi:unnamed protein product [Chrysodeixis includens]|uniref:Kazal-like domain-containing protein n=1 Tax=Chrysodeixis includens TaxID=689277 RepID=A0A9P0BVY6_CHRIL|nr:unnamed protein product [Chrysodeixis includens]
MTVPSRTILIVLTICVMMLCTINIASACRCPADASEICAKNGRTYGNKCEMECYGGEFAYYGKCKKANEEEKEKEPVTHE